MAGKVEVVLSAKDAEMVAAWQRARNNVAAFDAELSKINGTNARLEASGRKVWDQTRTPLERYNAEVERLAELLKNSAIDQETYNRAVQQQQTVLQNSDEKLKQVAASHQALEAAGKRAWEQTRTPLERYKSEVARLDELLKTGKIDQETYNRSLQQQNAILENTDENLRRVREENQRLETSGKRVWDQTRTPLERYNAEVAELDSLLKANRITQETHARAIQRQKDLYNQATNSSKSYLSGLSSGTMQVLAGLTGIGTVLGGILAVATQFRREYEILKSREKEASDRQMDVSTAQAAAYANLGTDPTMTRDQVDQKAAEIAKERGMSIRDVYNALSNAFSARGTESASAAVEAVDVAMLMNPGDAQGAEFMAGSILDLKKKSGGTVKQIAGQIIAAKQQARVVSGQAFAQNAIPAIFQLESFGNTQQESMAIYAAATQGIGDPTGEKTGSSIISFQRQLDDLVGKRGPKIQGMKRQLEYIRSKDGKKYRDYLLGTEKKQGKLKAEAKAYTTFAGFLTEGSVESKLLDQSLQVVPELGDQSQSSLEAYQKDIESSPVQRNALLRRRVASATENQQVQNVRGGLKAVSREGVIDYLKASGASQTSLDFLSTRMAASDALGGDVGNVAINALETRAKNLKTPRQATTVTGAGLEGFSGDYTIPAYTPGAKELGQAAEAQALADMLRESIELTKQQVDQQRRQLDLQEKQLAAQQEANKQPVEVNVQVNGQQGGRDSTPTKPRPAAALNAGGGG